MIVRLPVLVATLVVGCLLATLPPGAASAAIPDYTTAEAGNPFVDGCTSRRTTSRTTRASAASASPPPARPRVRTPTRWAGRSLASFHNGAQPIDQDVFIDDDGQAYIYYGGWGHANVAKLNGDMISLGTFPDGSTFKEITPPGYVEGPQMFKRNGRYYLMWSEGAWTGPDYSVSYAMSNSPTGPFTKLLKAYRETGDHDRADALYARVNAAAKAKWGDDSIDPDTRP